MKSRVSDSHRPTASATAAEYREDYFASRGYHDDAVVQYAQKEKRYNLRLASRWSGVDLLHGTGRTALDAGCGVGHNAAFLHGLGYEVLAVDHSAEGVEAAGQRYDPATFPRIRWGVADLDREIPAGSYDLVICWEVIEHLREPAAALERLYSKVKPGGVLVVTTPNKWGLWAMFLDDDPTHINVRSSAHWHALARRLPGSRSWCRSVMFWDHLLPWLRDSPECVVTWVPVAGFRTRLVVRRDVAGGSAG
jgi:2-polyprenyl-3-methyl-5-hydroxy-6-metoxy-1,4-benzoquinol methylase